jgi:hypothetical protein
MPDDESTIKQTATEETAIAADLPAHDIPTHETAIPASADTLVDYDPLAEDAQEWDEPLEELPRRPRRRLLGAGGNPIALALLGVLLIACGFIGGVLIEKGQSPSSPSAGSGATSLASRFAALRGGASGTGSSGASTGGAAAGGGGLFGGAAGAGATTGSVAYISGNTLYVTNPEGNTVKVTTSLGATVTKTVKASVKGIHPGETVVVTGSTGAKGAISAESRRVGSGAGGGGLAALFGGSGAGGSSGASKGGSDGGSGGGEPALFGKGG